MSRYRLDPTPEQEAILRQHCDHARFVYNMGQEVRSAYRPGRGPTPGFAEQCRQLTEARKAEPWLAEGVAVIQQQALRDLDQSWRNFFNGTHRRPSWRKARDSNGFRVVGAFLVRRVSRHVGEVQVPKAGWVRFRWSRAVPKSKSYRVTLDQSGRWHVSFAAIPPVVPGPGTGEVVGVDRGVAVTVALSNGELLHCPGLSETEQARLLRLQRRLAKAKRGSHRRNRLRVAIARLRARETDRRKDWAEKVSTDLARRFDVIRVEDLKITNMVRSAKGTIEMPGKNVRAKSGLNRSILANEWGFTVKRLEDKAPDRVEKINPAYTSQRCSACGHIAAESRKSQALFACVACTYTSNADVNAAINIAAGHAVTVRGGRNILRPGNRESLVAA